MTQKYIYKYVLLNGELGNKLIGKFLYQEVLFHYRTLSSHIQYTYRRRINKKYKKCRGCADQLEEDLSFSASSAQCRLKRKVTLIRRKKRIIKGNSKCHYLKN